MTRLEIAARIAAGMAVHRDLTYSAIAEYGLEIADELIRLEAETRPEPKPKPEPEQELPFEMVVGGVYEMRNGGVEGIIDINEHHLYLFQGLSGRNYTEKGHWIAGEEHQVDLIKRIR